MGFLLFLMATSAVLVAAFGVGNKKESTPPAPTGPCGYMLKRNVDPVPDKDICPEPYTDMTRDWCTGGLKDDAKFKTYVESLEEGYGSHQRPPYDGNIEFEKEVTSDVNPTQCFFMGADASDPMKIRWNAQSGPIDYTNSGYAKICYAHCPS